MDEKNPITWQAPKAIHWSCRKVKLKLLTSLTPLWNQHGLWECNSSLLSYVWPLNLCADAASQWCSKIPRWEVPQRFLRPQPFGTCPLPLAKHSLHNHLLQGKLKQEYFCTNWYLKAELLSFFLPNLESTDNCGEWRKSGSTQSKSYPGKVLGRLKTICSMRPLTHFQCRGQNQHCLSGLQCQGPGNSSGTWRKKRQRSGMPYTNASHPLGQEGEVEAHTLQSSPPRRMRVGRWKFLEMHESAVLGLQLAPL